MNVVRKFIKVFLFPVKLLLRNFTEKVVNSKLVKTGFKFILNGRVI